MLASGTGGAAGDDGGIVARHIADGEGDHRAGAQAAASRPPLMRERCLRTQFISPMGGTAGQQFVDALLFGQREAIGRQREQGRAAARR